MTKLRSESEFITNETVRGYRENETTSRFLEKLFGGDVVVEDVVNNLMWQQGGTQHGLTYPGAKKYIKELNENKHAGFNNWRLPTIDEAKTLIPDYPLLCTRVDVFSVNQREIWTIDINQKEQTRWVISFLQCNIKSVPPYAPIHARAIRTVALKSF
jgi:hypothetical protein